MTPTHITSFPSVSENLGKAAIAWQENKYGKAAREIARLDLSPQPLTGPQGMQRGFVDILV